MPSPDFSAEFQDRLAGKEKGSQRANARAAGGPMNTGGNARLDADAERPPAFTDEAIALRFADEHAAHLRYVALWGKWLIWSGQRWAEDNTLEAFSLVRRICRAAAAECNKSKIAAAIASARTVAAVERLAKSDRRLAATADQWDADPMLLNTTDGVADLRTGRMRGYRPDDYMTRIAAVGPGGDCPTWRLRFLPRVTAGDSALQAFLQRMAGYALTGLTREHALFFLYGTGANGKSVAINTVAGILGGYHRTVPLGSFTASSVDRHPTDLAGLRGARLVTAIETEEGRRWAESRIKSLTGGDPIAARFMRQDFFEFTPAFKLLIAGNHKPGLRSVDEAIRRRFNLIPLTVTIPPDERDDMLTEKLREEWPGILRWMIAGCLAWQREGLNPPQTVTAATTAYLEAEDTIAAWIEDCCERDPNAWESSTALYASFKSWADRAGEYAGSLKRFGERLDARGATFQRRKYGRGYLGLKLNPNHTGDAW